MPKFSGIRNLRVASLGPENPQAHQKFDQIAETPRKVNDTCKISPANIVDSTDHTSPPYQLQKWLTEAVPVAVVSKPELAIVVEIVAVVIAAVDVDAAVAAAVVRARRRSGSPSPSWAVS